MKRKSWAKTPKVRESRCIDEGSDLILADALVKCKNGLSGGDAMSHTPGFLFAPSNYDISPNGEEFARSVVVSVVCIHPRCNRDVSYGV